ncbi:MAG TPA: SMC-Scp complex subunit ScpB [Edaphobacter sp.]|uniref:SMC-Scp complex subunit ScpB n=1 Tax=Edaphobacter sp. TaxID=1934404 RepID=UPI002C07A374|nr:SMC-Scp complex subunit ScpB [Edaphobacter sp.]HUZ94155.1 SMC-Scp complex subunit ScpB [Edaphobacter sp.]
MSLKAKIEAVIYASEEPVTLAQLVGLLGHEAQAELDQIEAAQQSLDLEEAPADAETLNSEVLDEPEEITVSPAETDAPAPTVDEPKSSEPAEQGNDAPAGASPDEKKNARETKEKERRLREYFRSMLEQLINDYANGDRGLEIREVASGYRLATKPEYHDAVRGFVKSLKPPLKLSLQALETLAVVAYKQPVTAPEISEIRGVDSGGVLGSLMARKLVTTAGRKQVIGRPILYKTTRDFLLRFGLKDINELPSIEEFEKMAGELAEQEEIPMEHHTPEEGEGQTSEVQAIDAERHTHALQADGSPDVEDNPLDDELEDTADEVQPEAKEASQDEEEASVEPDQEASRESES